MNFSAKTKNGSSFVKNNYKIKISQTGKYLATIGEFVEIIDLEKKEIILSIEGIAINRKLPYNDVSFSFDDKYIALAGRNGDIKIWDIVQKKEIHTLKGHQDQVTSVSFMHKKNTLASGGMDDKVMLWNAESGKEIATMINIDDSDYIVVTPDNYYFSSKKALKNAAFRLKDQILPIEQFDLKYNRPDKVIKRIGTASIIKIKMYKKAYEKRLKRSGFTQEMLGDEFNLPELKVTDKYNLVTTTSDPLFKFNVKGHDNMYALDRLLVYINNVPINGLNGVKIATGKTKKIEKEIKVELSRGINKIQVSVINVKGVESIRDVFEVALDNEKIKPDLFLLAVGISEYDNSDRNLTYAAKDAQDFVNILEKSGQYNKINVKIVLNHDATKEHILKTADFLKNSKINDHVIVYFSSHGLLDEQLDYYLATTDVDFNNPSKKGLPYDKIEQLLEHVKSRNRLVLIDACHSGEIDKDEMLLADNNSNQHVKATAKSGTKIVVPKTGLKNSFTYMQVLFSDVSKGLGATIISAAGGMEFAYETNDKKNGLFTYSIIEGIESKKADLNKDGKIQLSELQLYIQFRVHQLSGGLQVPTMRKINSYNDFVIY
ncbi:MAG: caspase family protein [Flavobacteriales bacterium]|nr:caspase family protein [Flavobacteriales bacterium]